MSESEMILLAAFVLTIPDDMMPGVSKFADLGWQTLIFAETDSSIKYCPIKYSKVLNKYGLDYLKEYGDEYKEKN